MNQNLKNRKSNISKKCKPDNTVKFIFLNSLKGVKALCFCIIFYKNEGIAVFFKLSGEEVERNT